MSQLKELLAEAERERREDVDDELRRLLRETCGTRAAPSFAVAWSSANEPRSEASSEGAEALSSSSPETSPESGGSCHRIADAAILGGGEMRGDD